MKRICANPSQQWTGFRPAAYVPDATRVSSLPLIRVNGNEEQPTTVLQMLRELKDAQVEGIEDGMNTEIKTDTGVVTLQGVSFNRELLASLLSLEKEGINSLFGTHWFWFDSDSVRDDPHKSYRFFVVSGDKIVREWVSFSDYGGSGFDPTIFVEANAMEKTIWAAESDWAEAKDCRWYRKFYNETETGQLMVLRPDAPQLFHYERPQEGQVSSELLFALSVKGYRLLLVAIPLLVAVAFPSLKMYMAILGGAFFLDFVFICWKMRKVGSA